MDFDYVSELRNDRGLYYDKFDYTSKKLREIYLKEIVDLSNPRCKEDDKYNRIFDLWSLLFKRNLPGKNTYEICFYKSDIDYLIDSELPMQIIPSKNGICHIYIQIDDGLIEVMEASINDIYVLPEVKEEETNA